MKSSKLIILPILALGAMTGCAKKGGSSGVTITIWEDASNVAVVRELCNQFIVNYKETYFDAPSITIKIIEHTEKSAVEALQTLAPTGEGPDIAAVTHNTIAGGVDAEIIAPVEYKAELEARMTVDALKAVTVENRIGSNVYGYPITAESQVILYDNTKISATDLADFASIKASGKKLGLCLTGDNVGYYTWGLYSDSVLFGEDGKTPTSVNIGTEQSVANVTEFYNGIVQAGNSVFEDCEPETALNYVTSGRIAGFITSPYMLNDMKAALGDKLGIAKYPTLNGRTLSPFSGYKAYVVSRYSAHPHIAHALCNYLTSTDANLVRLTQKGYLPAVKSTSEIEEAIEASDTARIYKASFDESRVMPNITKVDSIWKPMNSAATKFKTRKNWTTAEVKAELDAVTTAILSA